MIPWPFFFFFIFVLRKLKQVTDMNSDIVNKESNNFKLKPVTSNYFAIRFDLPNVAADAFALRFNHRVKDSREKLYVVRFILIL